MYIHVKILASRSKEEIKKISADHYEICVKEPAKNNLANKRLIEIIKNLNPGAVVRIINGHHSPSKLVSVDND